MRYCEQGTRCDSFQTRFLKQIARIASAALLDRGAQVVSDLRSVKGGAVLVVDDEEPIRVAYRKLLEKMGVPSVFGAQDGIAAIEILHAHGPEIQVILLDLRMPRMNGMEFLRHLVNVHPHPVAVVLATAYPASDIEEEFFKSGSAVVLPAGYLPKPFSPHAFQEAVSHAQGLVRTKRSAMEQASSAQIQERLDRLASLVESLHKRTPNFWGQVGLQVAVTLILGAFVVVALLLGLDRLIGSAR
jgi:CheY-like chemotaxis protein